MAEIDLLIRGGRILDGTGNPWFYGDVAIRDGRIVAVGRPAVGRAHRVIDATGLFVCPGFIDLHTHSDLQLLANPRHEPKVMQGVTTDVIGQDGLSYAPVTAAALDYFVETVAALNGKPDLDYSWRSVDDFLNRFDRQVAVNVAYLLPHGPVRVSVLGVSDRQANASELAAMQELVDQGMRDGAVGFSTGLTYAPCVWGDTAELVALCRAAAPYGVSFMPHLRSYGTGVVAATEEALQIAREAGIALHLTHHQVVFDCNKDNHVWYTALIDDARAAGLDVTCDSYPYIAGSTYLIGLFPGWAQGQGRAAVVQLLRDPEAAERLRHEIEETGCDGTHGVPIDWSRLQLAAARHPDWASRLGTRFDELGRQLGRSPWEVARRLLIDNDGQVNIVSFFGHEHAVQHIMRHPAHLIGSDGILVGDRPHPRVYGTFPRYLGRYVRELGILDWPTCVRKMTGGPAARLGLVDRGLLQAGFAADLALFDPATIADTATFESPRQYPTGLPYVIVNGQVVKDQGEHTGVLAGRALRRGRPAA
ncbi:MAG: D-aminoacylase [Fimbriimonadaceae bacterium]|nr:D-aminoacylase [Fimbriimonadaceae bacterium]